MSFRSNIVHAVVWSSLFGAGLLAHASVRADDGDTPPRRDDPGRPHAGHKPPPAAYDACADSAQGDACQVRFADQTIDGMCVPDREDGTLFCMPEHPPRPPHAAFDACEGKHAADSCSVTRMGHSEPGSCVATPDQQLVCRPPMPGTMT